MVNLSQLDRTAQAMGAVQVKVKLTNAIDEALVRRGLLDPNRLRVYEVDALIDTGAVRTVLPNNLVQQLGLNIRGQQVAQYANGLEETIGLTEPVIIEIDGRETIEAAFCPFFPHCQDLPTNLGMSTLPQPSTIEEAGL